MFWYIVFTILLALAGCLVIMKWQTAHKVMKWFAGIVLIVVALCVLMSGLNATDWSAGADNWSNVAKVNDYVTNDDTEITSVKKYHGYMMITLKGGTVDFGDTKSANTANTFDQCLGYAKDAKSGVASKGVIIYQKPQHGDMSNFAIFYAKKDFNRIPSVDSMEDDRSVVLKKATAYSLGAANYNSTGLAGKGVKIESSQQPKWFNDFAGNHYLGN
jgi:hypothetical protein